MVSGLLDGKYLNGEKSKARSLLKKINKKRRISFLNRILYERLSDENMYYFAQKFSFSENPLSILKRAYKGDFKTLARWINIKKKYEIHSS